MKLTQKIRTTIKMLKEVESECGNNYFNLNNSKYYVLKNNLYKNQDYDKPVGTIKNGQIKIKSKKGEKSLITLKKVHKSMDKSRSKSRKTKSFSNAFTPNIGKSNPFSSEPFSDAKQFSFEKSEPLNSKTNSSFGTFKIPESNSKNSSFGTFKLPEKSETFNFTATNSKAKSNGLSSNANGSKSTPQEMPEPVEEPVVESLEEGEKEEPVEEPAEKVEEPAEEP